MPSCLHTQKCTQHKHSILWPYGLAEVCIILPFSVTSFRIGEINYRLATDYLPVLGAFIIFLISRKRNWALTSAIFFCAVFTTHFFLASAYAPIPEFSFKDIAPWLARFLVLGMAYVYLSSVITAKTLLSTLVILFRIELIAALLFWVVSFTLGLHIGVSYGPVGAFPRSQGFLTEPSMLSWVIPPFIILSIIDRRGKDVGLAILVGILSFSPTVYLVTLLSIAILTFMAGSRIQKFALYIVVATSICAFSSLHQITNLLANVENPIGSSIYRLLNGLVFFTDSGGGYNVRGDVFFQSIDVINSLGLWSLGAGIGMHVPIGDILAGGAPLDISIISLFLVDFGLPGTLALLLCVCLNFYLIRHDIKLFSVLAAFTIASILNGGGSFAQYFFLSLILIILTKHYTIIMSAAGKSPKT